MDYPYHFVNLDNDGNARRRRLLDSYGQFAQLSALFLPLIYYLGYGLLLLVSRSLGNEDVAPDGSRRSPTVSRFRESKPPTSEWSARFRWVLDDEVVEGWGTLKDWLFAGFWTLWLLVLAVRETGDDYLHLTKRFGIIAASQLPLHYALALKAWSPIQYLTRLSHEELNSYHRSLGRIIAIFFSLHASMYLNFYVQKGLLSKRIRDWDVILGLTAITTALLLNGTALSKVRTWSYRLFFYAHVTLSTILLPVLYLHVSHLRVYILETAAIYSLLIFQRNGSQSPALATINQLPKTNLLSITIPFSSQSQLTKKSYNPGQHIYLGFPSLSQKLRINPFSIANPFPITDGKLHLVARRLTGTTAILADMAESSRKTQQPVPLLIEGPYGSATHFPDLTAFDRVLFVAGGVGATFTLPLFIDLLRREKEGEKVPAIRFVWTVRQSADAKWGFELLREQLGEEAVERKLCRIELFVSGSGQQGDDTLAIELPSRKIPLFSDNARPTSTTSSTTSSLNVIQSRPNLPTIASETFSHNANADEKVAVLVCGPKGMGASLRREVGRWVWKGRDVWWHGEEFGW